jgi:3-dehydroquinate synthase
MSRPFTSQFGEFQSTYKPCKINKGVINKLSPDAIICDSKVARLYKNILPVNVPLKKISGGEQCKTYQKLEQLHKWFATLNISRNGTVVVIGGGSVMDLGAMAVSTWKRGSELILVPTTLLGAVDASIGGKTAINLGGLKNPIGTFYPASEILFDVRFFNTLQSSQISDGMAELIKTAVIGNKTFFNEIYKNRNSLDKIPEDWVLKAAKIKTRIVEADFKEIGLRKTLNLGHTLGHALELQLNISHGQAVALGMVSAFKVSTKMGLCNEVDSNKIITLIEACGLKTTSKISYKKAEKLIANDKKPGWVLPLGIGAVIWDQKVDLKSAIDAISP